MAKRRPSGYRSDKDASSSASSDCRSFVAIENGCIVGTIASTSGDSAPSLPIAKPTVEWASPSVCPSSWISVAWRSNVRVAWPLISRYMSWISASPLLITPPLSPNPFTAAGVSPKSVRIEPSLSRTTSWCPSPFRLPHLVRKLSLVKSSAAIVVVASHGSRAVATLFHVLIAVVMLLWNSGVVLLSIVRWIGNADVRQCCGSSCDPTVWWSGA